MLASVAGGAPCAGGRERGSPYRQMSIEHAYVPARAEGVPSEPATSVAELVALAALAPPTVRVDEGLLEVAAELTPGKALKLGCASEQDAVWLAQRGWTVTAVDGNAEVVEATRQAANNAGVTIALHLADLAAW